MDFLQMATSLIIINKTLFVTLNSSNIPLECSYMHVDAIWLIKVL